MKNRIDFGDIGIKIGDEIVFRMQPTLPFVVASGNGTPGNGGTLVKYSAPNTPRAAFSLRAITRQLLGSAFSHDSDIYELWSYRGRTLRSLYNTRGSHSSFLLE